MKKNKYTNRKEFDFRRYFWFRMKGFTNAETKRKMGCGLRTIQIYSKQLRDMSDEEFMELLLDNSIYFKPIEEE